MHADYFITELKGHSGCKLYLYRTNGGVRVRKISKDLKYNCRLKKQMKIQHKFSLTGIAPTISGCGMINGLFYFDMEYINGRVLSLALIDMSATQINNTINYIISKLNYSFNNSMEIPHILKNKINALNPLKMQHNIFAVALNILEDANWEALCLGKGHGDLTLENIIITDDGEIFFIDFLDSFYHSAHMDYAKLLQDLHLYWSWRYLNIPNSFYININYAKDILIQYYRQYFGGSLYYLKLLMILNVLRIVPYVKDHATFNWCVNSIKALVDHFETDHL